MPFTLNLKRIVIGGVVAVAVGAGGIGAAAAANASPSDAGITAVSGVPQNVIPGEATKLDTVPKSDQSGHTRSGTAEAPTLTAVPGAVPQNVIDGGAITVGTVPIIIGQSGNTTAAK